MSGIDWVDTYPHESLLERAGGGDHLPISSSPYSIGRFQTCHLLHHLFPHHFHLRRRAAPPPASSYPTPLFSSRLRHHRNESMPYIILRLGCWTISRPRTRTRARILPPPLPLSDRIRRLWGILQGCSPLPLLSLPCVIVAAVVVSLRLLLLLLAPSLLMYPLDLVIQTSGDDVPSLLV